MYKKTIIAYPEIHISNFHKHSELPNILFIHGGPGLNAGILECLIEQKTIFYKLNANIITYDQRACGRSRRINAVVSHQDNINDLKAIIDHLALKKETRIDILAGHSYGGKLLYDFSMETKTTMPSVYISCPNSILIPRINNLILDMNYLKTVNVEKYNQILNEIDDINHENIWNVSEKFASIFHENKARSNFYWFDLVVRDKVKEIESIINLPINIDVFDSIREDIYSDKKNYNIDLMKLNNRYLKINGLHDCVMGLGTELGSENVKVFGRSSHYPHIEENEKFCKVLNEFIALMSAQ